MKRTVIILCVLVIAAVGIGFKLKSNTSHAGREVAEELKPINVNLDTMTVRLAKLEKSVNVAGVTEPRSVVTIVSETDGKVVISNLEAGKQVEKGQQLALLDTDIKKANHRVNLIALEKSKKDHERMLGLLQDGNAAQSEVDNALQQLQTIEQQVAISNKQLEQSIISSPVTGVIIENKIHTGDVLLPGNPVAVIAELDPLIVKVFVTQDQFLRISKDQQVEIFTDLFPKQVFRGRVTAIIPVPTMAKTYPVEISLSNREGKRLIPGIIVSVKFNGDLNEEALLVPRTSVLLSRGVSYVYVLHGDKLEKRIVKPGKDYGSSIIMLEGLKAGDIIVTRGQQILENEARIANYKIEDNTINK